MKQSLEQNPRLQAYADLLRQWQAKINLVSNATLDDLWTRHMADSAQLLELLPKRPCRLLDMGSGAGFPGLVLAILGAGEVTLVESDVRKCAFLREAARITETPVTIHSQRLEQLPPQQADVITARALAPIAQLLHWGQPHLNPGGIYLFLKGQAVEEELTAATKQWHISEQRLPSATDPRGQIVRITEATARS